MADVEDKVQVVFNKDDATIEFRDDDQYLLYTIDLDRCTNAAELLDWVLQVNTKSWATPQVVKDTLDRIEEVCEHVFDCSAQGVFCPGGKFATVTWEE